MKSTHINCATSDERGNISDVLYKTDIQHVSVVNTVGGQNVIRGNHYHKETTQYIFVTKGYLYYWYKTPGQEVEFIRVDEFDLVETPPFEIHALHIPEENQFMVFTNGKRGGQDYESDTFRSYGPILTKEMLLVVDKEFYSA